jgi:general transcription factor 3C polypeptide 5 (transcription factor C subunit 1)
MLCLFTFRGCDSAPSLKLNPMSTTTIVVDEKTGEEKERLINKGRWKGYGPTSVSFSEKGVRASCRPLLRQGPSGLWITTDALHDFVKVPTKPPSNVEEVRNQYDQTVVQQLEEVKSCMPA